MNGQRDYMRKQHNELTSFCGVSDESEEMKVMSSSFSHYVTYRGANAAGAKKGREDNNYSERVKFKFS